MLDDLASLVDFTRIVRVDEFNGTIALELSQPHSSVLCTFGENRIKVNEAGKNIPDDKGFPFSFMPMLYVDVESR